METPLLAIVAFFEFIVILFLIRVILKKNDIKPDKPLMHQGNHKMEKDLLINLQGGRVACSGNTIRAQPLPKIAQISYLNPCTAPSTSAIITKLSPKAQRLKACVCSVRLHRNGYAEFQIRSNGNVEVWHRYSDFARLRSDIVLAFGTTKIPTLPPKRWFGSSIERTFLEGRRSKLDSFIVTLLADPIVACSTAVMHFLGRGTGQLPVPDAAPIAAMIAPLASGSERKSDRSTPFAKSGPDPASAKHTVSPIMKTAAKTLKRSLGMMQRFVRDGQGWELCGEKEPGGIKVYLQSQSRSGVICTKTTCTVNAPPRAVAELLRNGERKSEYDKNFVRETLVEALDITELSHLTGQKVLYAAVCRTESRSPMPSFLSPRDAVTLVTQLEKDNGAVLVLLGFIEHPAAPPVKDFVRASIIGGGSFIEPLPGNPNQSRCTVATQININGTAPPYWILKRAAPKQTFGRFKRFRAAALDKSKWPASLFLGDDKEIQSEGNITKVTD